MGYIIVWIIQINNECEDEFSSHTVERPRSCICDSSRRMKMKRERARYAWGSEQAQRKLQHTHTHTHCHLIQISCKYLVSTAMKNDAGPTITGLAHWGGSRRRECAAGRQAFESNRPVWGRRAALVITGNRVLGITDFMSETCRRSLTMYQVYPSTMPRFSCLYHRAWPGSRSGADVLRRARTRRLVGDVDI